MEPFLAVLYFCSFMLVCSYILLQLIIGIILDSIQAATVFDYLSVGPVSHSLLPSLITSLSDQCVKVFYNV